MAQRVQVDTSSLRRLDQKTAVVARPVDTMVSVSNQVQQNSQLQQTANALAQINPDLNKFLVEGQKQRNEDDLEEGTAAWQKANDKEKKAYLKAIKSGQIDEVESPFYIKGMSKGILRDRARDYGQQLVIDWNAKKGTKGFNIDKFLTESKTAYVKEHGLDGFADNIFNSEFGRLADAYGNQVSQRNYEDRLKQTRQARLTLLGQDVVGAAAKATSNDGKFNATTYIAEVNKVMEQAISEGLDPTNSRQQVLAQLQAMATTDPENSKAYIDAAAQLSTRYGKYGETGKGALWVAEQNDFFENKAEQDADEDWTESRRAAQLRLLSAEIEMQKAINGDANYLSTKEGKSALDQMSIMEGGRTLAQNFKNQYEEDAKVVTDTDEYNTVATSIQSGAGTIDADDIDSYTNISGEDKLKLKQMLGAGARLQVAQSRLGLNDYVTDLERFATKRDPNDPLASVYGTVAPQFEKLGMAAREAAAEVVLEADRQFDLLNANGRAKARTYIREQFEILKKDIEDQRTEIRGQELQDYSTSMGNAGGLGPENGGSVDKTTADTASIEGVTPEALPIYTFLPKGVLDNAVVEAKRPVSKVLPKKYESFSTGPILEFTNNADIQSLMEDYATVFNNPDQAFSESRLVNMAMQYGVTVDELGTQLASQMDANLKAQIAEEERLKQAALVDLTDDQTDQVLRKMSENSLDPSNMNDVAVAASELFPFVTSDQIAKLHNKLNIKPETIDYSSDDADDEALAITQTKQEINESRQESGAEVPPSILMRMVSQEQYDAMSVDAQQKADQQAIEDQEAETEAEAEAVANVASELIYDASDEQIELISGVLSGYDLSDTNAIAAQVQKVFPDINEQQLRDIIQRVGPNTAPEGVDMASPSMVSPTSTIRNVAGMQAPSMSSSSPDGAVNTGVEPQSGTSMMPASSKAQLPKAGKQDEAVAPVSRQDERQMRKVLRDLRMAEAQQLSALEANADKAAAAADLKRLNAKKQKELKAEIARKREQGKQEFLKRQSLMQSKRIAKFIAERAEKFPEKFGVTMSDDLDSYLAKTKPLWFALWDGLLPDGQEIPAVFYEVLKENMRKRISN